MNAQATRNKQAAPPDPGITMAIPLNKLVLSELNARKTYPDEDVIGLSDNIHERGLHQNLVVSKSPTLRGIHEVDAGGRRFLALKRNVKLGRLPGDWPVPVKIVPREEAAEASLDENIQKIALNPADEFTAYARIIAGYEADGMADPAERIAQCARRRGVTVRHVEQRLRLAALAPEILDALRAGTISLDAAKAYAGHPDHEQQLNVFAAEEKKPEGWRHGIPAIRDAIKRRTYPVDHKAVLYIGLDAYLVAGGRVGTDLFMGGEEREEILDPSIVDRLVEAKAAREARALAAQDGWAGGAVKPWQVRGDSFAEPAGRPRGTQQVFVGKLEAAEKPSATLWYELKPDGSGLQAMDFAFAPVETVDETRARAAAGSVDTETLHRERVRKLQVELTAARLAMPPIAGTPLEGRTHWPKRVNGIDALHVDEESGDFVIALLVRIPAADVLAKRDAAEWEIADRESRAAAADAAATKVAPGPDDEPIEEPVAKLAEMIEARISARPGLRGIDGIAAAQRFARELIAELERDHGARYRESYGTRHLQLAGIKVSCTAGKFALLDSWVAKARKLAAEAPPAKAEAEAKVAESVS
jgi:ParB family chromosome partitioning protein